LTEEMIDFAADLNPEQHAAVTAGDGPVLVLAAAGTGKTRTLVYRVAYLVERGIDAQRLLLLTFTNRASKEMLERARTLVGSRVSGVWGGTFHHMANRILRRYAPLIDYTADYAILDRDDARRLLGECIKDLKLGADFLKPAVLLSLFSAAANTERPVHKLAERRFASEGIDPADVTRLHAAYAERKRRINGMDFDDLLVNCLLLLREHANVTRRYQDHFEHVLVDEYQDTSTLQSEIIDLLAAAKRNLLVVGDDFQSIYSWRGADFRNILSFPERYSDVRVYKLETNYRSVPEILAVANASIAANPDQFRKTLRATRNAYRRPRVAAMRDGDEQARFVAQKIRAFRREGYRYSDIAVLYRAHYHALELERVMPRENLPYVITSGVRFFEQAHIKDVCSLLRVLCFPAEEMAFKRLLGLLPGVGAKTVEKLWAGLNRRFDAGDSAQREWLLKSLPGKARAQWNPIDNLMREYVHEGLEDDGGEVMYRFGKVFYADYAVRAYEDHEKRMDDIAALALDTARYDDTPAFLNDIALLTNLDTEVPESEEGGGDAVRLSTIHQAKGLEWPVVIMLWVTDGMLPLARALEEEHGTGAAEERRLFYVAVTRAKDELVLCVPEVRRKRDGGVIPCRPSRFIEDIPPRAIETERAGFI